MESPADRLKAARLAAGYPAASHAAHALGVPLATYQQHENGIRGYPARRAAIYAARFRVKPEWLLYGAGDGPKGHRQTPPPPPARYVPIVGEVGSDLWLTPEPTSEPGQVLPVYLPQYDETDLFALRVHGHAMDLDYAPGALVIACPIRPAQLNQGDHIVLRSRRGALVELTIKEALKDPMGVALWPRSSEAKYQTPLKIPSFNSPDAPELVGLVVASYFVRPREGPLLNLTSKIAEPISGGDQ